MNQLCHFGVTVFLAACAACIVSQDDSTKTDRMQPIVGKAIAAKIDIGIELSVSAPVFKYSRQQSRLGNSALEVELVKTERRELKFPLLLLGNSGKAEFASSVVDMNDRPLSFDSILQRLETESPVLICLDGQMVDKDFGGVVKDDVLVIKIGPMDSFKMRSLVPGTLTN